MKIVCIFETDASTKEGLYAIQYDGETENEYDRLFNLWMYDPDYIAAYLNKNQSYLKHNYFKEDSARDIVRRILQEANELSGLLFDFAESGTDKKLQEAFRPLIDAEFFIPIHQKTKVSIKNWKYRKAIIRIYAIRISANTYIITGGAIKLVQKMQGHPDTNHELKKLELVKKHLKSIGLFTEDDLSFIL